MATVLDFKNLVCNESAVRYGGDYVGTPMAHSDFCMRSEAHVAFWQKLNRLGGRNMKSQLQVTVPNIDATVELTNQEWMQLEDELQQLW